MIISASRRTDIPAHYAEWFMRRIRAGFCTVQNPRNPRQAATVSLRPADVEAIVFWTRNAEPMIPFLAELDTRGYRYYFQYTLMDNPAVFDPGVPGVEKGIESFRKLAGRIGAERVVWRYDPIVLSSLTPPEFHERAFGRIAGALKGFTRRCVISVLDVYPKVARRLRELEGRGVRFPALDDSALRPLVRRMAGMARECGMDIVSCAETFDWEDCGVTHGSCVDAELIERVWGCRVPRTKDPAQRAECRCVVSRDIGAYDTCPAGCVYCYATTSMEPVVRHRSLHDPSGPALLSFSPTYP